MKYEDFCELAALYALDVLGEPERHVVEAAIAEFPEFETELAALQAAVAAIPYSAPTMPMTTDLKHRLFQRITSETSEQKAALVASPLIPAGLPTLAKQAAHVSWKPYSVSGAMIGEFYVDPGRREIACFVRTEAGVRFPHHLHAGDEEIVVLEGDLVIDGEIYGRGDCIRSVPGSAHRPETYSGCMLFLRTSLDDEILP